MINAGRIESNTWCPSVDLRGGHIGCGSTEANLRDPNLWRSVMSEADLTGSKLCSSPMPRGTVRIDGCWAFAVDRGVSSVGRWRVSAFSMSVSEGQSSMTVGGVLHVAPDGRSEPMLLRSDRVTGRGRVSQNVTIFRVHAARCYKVAFKNR